MSSIVGIGCFSLTIAAFALRLFIQSLMSSPFGIITVGETHLDDPITGSMISMANSSFNLRVTFESSGMGIRLYG